jgi:STE24 endopeptidase
MSKVSSWLLVFAFAWLVLPVAVVAQPTPSDNLDIEAATDAYLSRLSPEEKESSDSYFEGGYWLQLWGLLYTIGVSWLLLGSGLSARMRDLAERLTQRKPLQTFFYTAQYIVVATILFFPLTVYQGFFREHQYGLATQTFLPWMRDQLVDLGVSVILLPLLLIPLYGVFRKAPKTWWIWGSAVGIVFVMFLILIAPVYIDPLFNTYVPLEDEAVKEPILSMARANGIAVDNVYQFDASRQSNRRDGSLRAEPHVRDGHLLRDHPGRRIRVHSLVLRSGAATLGREMVDQRHRRPGWHAASVGAVHPVLLRDDAVHEQHHPLQ